MTTTDSQQTEFIIAKPDGVGPVAGDGKQVDVRTEEILVNMGPQHPSTHGVLRIVLRTDGEMVLEAVPHIGYLHRCAEKIGENVAYFQYVPYTDRMDYLAAMNENWTWCHAVEKLAGLELPRRARTTPHITIATI